MMSKCLDFLRYWKFLAIVSVIRCAYPCEELESIRWFSDIPKAVAQSRETGLPVFVYITAHSTGDPRAVEIHKWVRDSEPDWRPLIGCHYVYLRIDTQTFPQTVIYEGQKMRVMDVVARYLQITMRPQIKEKTVVGAEPPAIMVIMDDAMQNKRVTFRPYQAHQTKDMFVQRLKSLRFSTSRS